MRGVKGQGKSRKNKKVFSLSNWKRRSSIKWDGKVIGSRDLAGSREGQSEVQVWTWHIRDVHLTFGQEVQCAAGYTNLDLRDIQAGDITESPPPPPPHTHFQKWSEWRFIQPTYICLLFTRNCARGWCWYAWSGWWTVWLAQQTVCWVLGT